jgi:hypothetical protein
MVPVPAEVLVAPAPVVEAPVVPPPVVVVDALEIEMSAQWW